MKFLLDTSAENATPTALVAGQLLTPLSNYRLGTHPFAIDNGGFTSFDPAAFRRLITKCQADVQRCVFVALPDVVGSARRTLEMFDQWDWQLSDVWPRALVMQDGIEDLPIPWNRLAAVFIGGTTHWKESQHAADVVRAAIIAEKHAHVGRVNTIKRFRKFEALGCHTCDGSGVVRFGWMLDAIRDGQRDDHPRLPFGDELCDGGGSVQPVGTDVVADG